MFEQVTRSTEPTTLVSSGVERLLLWRELPNHVLTVKELGECLKDQRYRDRIVGCGSYSLSFIAQGFDKNALSLPAVTDRFYNSKPSINIDLSAPLRRKLYPNENTPPDGIRELLIRNRGFAQWWTACEVAREILGTNAILWVDPFYSYKLHLYHHPIEEGQTILDHIRSANLPEWVNVEELYYAVKAGFRTDEEYYEFLNRLKERGGVQIILKNREGFTGFLETVNHAPIDDNGCTIYSSIPSDYVDVIVPLGKYEKELFGVK